MQVKKNKYIVAVVVVAMGIIASVTVIWLLVGAADDDMAIQGRNVVDIAGQPEEASTTYTLEDNVKEVERVGIAGLQRREKTGQSNGEEANVSDNNIHLKVRVLRLHDLKPVTSYRLQVFDDNSKRKAKNNAMLCADVVTDTGMFDQEVPFRENIEIRIDSKHYLTKIVEKPKIKKGSKDLEVTIYLERTERIGGLVLAANSEEKIDGARVLVLEVIPKKDRVVDERLGSYGTLTARDGSFVLDVAANKGQTIVAIHEKYSESVVPWQGEEEIVLRMRKGFSISGTIRDKYGNPYVGARIEIYDSLTPIAKQAVASDVGWYEVPQLGVGEHRVIASGVGGLADSRFPREEVSITIIDRDVAMDFGQGYEAFAIIVGGIYGYSHPDAGEFAIILRDSDNRKCIGIAIVDDTGEYRFEKVPQGQWLLSIRDGNIAGEVPLDELSVDECRIYERDYEIPSGAILGTVFCGGEAVEEEDMVQLWFPTTGLDTNIHYCSTNAQGEFQFQGLPFGTYHLLAQSKKWGCSEYYKVVIGSENCVEKVAVTIQPKGRVRIHFLGLDEVSEDTVVTLNARLLGTTPPKEYGGDLGIVELLGSKGWYGLNLTPGQYEITIKIGDNDENQMAWVSAGRDVDVTFDLSIEK